MQITALLSDIHGNLPALEAALTDAKAQGVERFVFLGDYIFDMPWSNAVVHRLMDLKNAVFVAGNKEERLHTLRLDDPAARSDQFATVYQTLRELEPDVLDWLKALPREAHVPLEGGRTLKAVHFPYEVRQLLRRRFSTQSYFRRCERILPSHAALLREFRRELALPEYAPFLDALDGDALAFGHNHLQHWGTSRGRTLVDCGAVGVPADFIPGAAYALLVDDGVSLRVRERRVSYDREAAIRAAMKSELYARGRVWCELLFRAIRESRDYTGAFLRFAFAMAEARGEALSPLADALWNEAYALFTAQLEAGAFYPKYSSSELERSE